MGILVRSGLLDRQKGKRGAQPWWPGGLYYQGQATSTAPRKEDAQGGPSRQ